MDNKKLNYEIKPTSFNFVNSSNKIADKKLDTKPTSFAKDAFKRFCKNKSSVVAFFVLGIIILLAIFVPVFSPYNTKRVSATEKFLAPKLFESGTGFWDGCVKYEKKVNLDGSISGVLYDTETGGPAGYRIDAVKDLVVDKEPTYINQAVAYGKDGYVIFENQNQKTLGNDSLISLPFTVAKDGEYTLTINLNDTEGAVGGSLGEYRVQFVENTTDSPRVITIRDWSTDYSSIENYNLSSALEQLDANLSEMEGYLSFELKAKSEAYSYILLESVVISSQNADETTAARLAEISFTDATKMVLKTKPLEGDSSGAFIGYWTATGRKGIFKSEVFYCTFIYDTYAAVYGEESMVVSRSDLKSWVDAGYCEYDFSAKTQEERLDSFKVLDERKCPIKDIESEILNPVTNKLLEVNAKVDRYKKMGYEVMPKFILGTDESGHDLFTKMFLGLRTSLVLGVFTFLFCFFFGLVFGAIEGYFGGSVDLIMERFCDILGGVPWIVVMTLAILHFGNNFLTFFMALCLTGWMGTAARTRTQFYRFKGREYVLAARTLGARDTRLIFKHILPNALGTIVTGAVLMIPSTIYSEATLAYLNLGLRGIDAFGVMLAGNQQYIQSHSYLIVWPSIVMAFLMVAFNLFGNGLRDAVNPTLKGSE